jgi:Protein of unknown function (DUF3995)
VPSFYWAAGGTAGAETIAADIEELGLANPWLLGVTGVLKVVGGLVALALVRPWGEAIPRRILLAAAWGAAALLLLYAAANFVDHGLMEAGVRSVPTALGRAHFVGISCCGIPGGSSEAFSSPVPPGSTRGKPALNRSLDAADREGMPASGASARRATWDAIALALAFLAVDALIITAVLAELVEPAQGIVTILALAAVVLLLYRDDVAEAIAAGNEKLGLTVDDEPVRRALDALGREDGWTVEQDFLSAHGRRIGTVVHGPSGSYLVETRNRAYRVEHLGRARHHAAWLHGEVGGWVTPVLCLVQRDDRPHRRDGVWIMGVEHLAEWLRGRTAPRGRSSRG